MSDTLIKVENVSKKFCRSLKRSLWYGMQDIGAELLGRSHQVQNGLPTLRPDEFWAVQDINFELKRGDCLGLIGRNGAGKSTLLKMLNGLLKPDTGRIEMRGRIGALIELGTGFNPILTGRENVYVNGSVLGFSKKEIDRKFEAIVEFAEIGDFIDMPVKNYSSGMKVRLGFAVAAQMDPDVLLVDEVLAVGDVGFKIKCYNEIYTLMGKAAVIFVSHSMPQVGKICSKGMLMDQGRRGLFSHNVPEVIQAYYNSFGFTGATQMGSNQAVVHSFIVKTEDSMIELKNNEILSKGTNERTLTYTPGMKLEFILRLRVNNDIDYFKVMYSFSDVDQKVIAQVNTEDICFANNNQEITIHTTIPELFLNAGNFSIGLIVLDTKGENSFSGFLLGYRDIVKLTATRDTYLGVAPIIYDAEWVCKDRLGNN